MGGCKVKELTTEEKVELLSTLLAKVKNDGKLPRGSQTEVAQQFCINPRTVRRVWSAAKLSREHGRVILEEVRKKTDTRGRNSRRYFASDVQDAIQEIPLRLRQSWSDLARALDIPKTTLLRMKGDGILSHTSPLEQSATKDENNGNAIKQSIEAEARINSASDSADGDETEDEHAVLEPPAKKARVAA